jgi:hypothetical protein
LPQTYVPPTGQAEARALTTSFIDDTVMPKILTWSLGVQHEVYRNATVEVRYLGTRGLSLPVQYRRNFESGFDAGLAPLPEYFRAQDVPATVSGRAATRAPWDAFTNCTPPTPPATTPAPCNNVYFPFGFAANVTSDPPFASSTYHAGSINFTQRARYGFTFNANYTYAHTLDNATNEFFTSLLNPRRSQNTNRLRNDWASSDLDVRHKVALSWTYQVPNIKSDSRWVKTLANGFSIGSVFLAQTGQPVTLQSASDSNGNGDTAGDRVMFNPFGTNPTGGSNITRVCAPVGGGSTVVAATCPAGDNTVGYLALDPTARYVIAGKGVVANVGRNSFYTPGFSVLNLSVNKDFHFTESKYLQARVQVFNVLNHPSFALSNGNVFSTTGTTVATTTPGYVRPNDPNFLAANTLFSGGFRSMTLGLKFVF